MAKHPFIMKGPIDQNLLSQQSWVRSTGQTHYRMTGICITRENYKAFFQAVPAANCPRTFAGNVLHTLSISPIVLPSEDALSHFEESWTGKARPSTSADSDSDSDTPTHPVLASIRVSYYISTQWEVVKQLSYLAISHDILPDLFEFAAVSVDLSSLSKTNPRVPAAHIPFLCERLQQRAFHDDLVSAVRRSVITIKTDPIIGMLYCGDAAEDALLEKQKGATNVVDLVEAYRMLLVGRSRPDGHSLRESETRIARSLPSVTPEDLLEAMRVVRDSVSSNWCLFLTRHFQGQAERSELGHYLLACLKDVKATRCVQLDGEAVPSWSSKKAWAYKSALANPSPRKGASHDSLNCSGCAIIDVLLTEGNNDANDACRTQ